jgi:rhomboid protease GluP
LAHFFITNQDYRIIRFFENQKELWLEKLENKKAPIIRMMLHDLDWSNSLQRDIEFVATNGERVRKQIGRSELHVMNIYISQFPPVDEYEYRLTSPYVYPEGNKTTVSSILLAKGEFEKGFQRISEKLNREVGFPIEEYDSEQDVEALKKAALEHAIKKEKSEKAILTNGKPFFTYIFMIIQVAVFFWLETHGGSTNTSTLIKYGAKVNVLIYQGQWWRFITPVFLHIGFMHLFMNTLALYYLGVAVEKIFGNVRFLFIYLFAGVTGFIASFLFSANLSAGASGAIFGCFGALLYFCVIYPKLFFRTMGANLFVVLALNLVFGFSASGIDNSGHLGGLAGGFLAAGIMHFPKKRKLGLQLLFLMMSIAIVSGSLFYGFSTSERGQNESSTTMMAQEYIKQNDYDEAYHLLMDFEEKSKNPSERIYLILAFVEMKKKMFPDAKTHLDKAIKLDPNMSEAYYYLALINLDEDDVKQAKVNAEKAVKIKPNEKEYLDLVSEINKYLLSSGGGG